MNRAIINKYDLKQKNVLQSPDIKNCLISGYVFLGVTAALIMTILLRKWIYISIVGILWVAVAILLYKDIRSAIKFVKNYNYLLENGKIVKGKIGFAYTFRQTKVSATYFDDKSEMCYNYCTFDSKAFNSHRLKYYAKKYPQIYILVDKDNLSNGYILIREYYKEMNEKHGDEPYKLENLKL
ncbi:MAG: hypothetical protein J6K43_09710 [Lachnospiraceae bacterium]|nr:hypothetical protein [Lachnospiraceae bacterium]